MSKVKEEFFLKKILEFLEREEESVLERAEEESREGKLNKADFYSGQASAFNYAQIAIRIISTQKL